MSVKELFVDGWDFSKQRIGVGLSEVRGNWALWSPVDLPHDWLIYDTGNLYENAEGWYRKTLEIDGRFSDRLIALRFEGVYMDSAVFINGVQVFEWKYGYSTFEFDITAHVRPGANEVLVRTVNQSPNSRWYSGAGIYRNVWLKKMSASHIVSDGVYVVARRDGSDWRIDVSTELELADRATGLSLAHSVIDADGKVVARVEGGLGNGHGATADRQILKVANPSLWDIDDPRLYALKTELIREGKAIDEETQRFGFRSVGFHPNDGFSLNGRRVELRGVCQHHDLGCLGAAVNKAALKRQMTILKEMGVNAIRTAHNMPAVELMDLADEMGVLVVSEAFDMWEKPKTKYDYARFFPDWAERDVASWVRRDRNHPSLIMWSIGNEIHDTHSGERGREATLLLRDMVRRHDPDRNAEATIGSNYMPWEGAQNCADAVKLAGYNYCDGYYAEHHDRHPDWIIYGSETCSVVQSRGVYHFPASQSVLADDDEQCSSLGNSSTSWGAKSTESCIVTHRDAEFCLGQFIWSGFDYLGEPTPYFTKNSYFGQIDTAGFKKDSFYVFQAEWTDYRKAPMVHLFPYWDFNEGQMIDVKVCSNAPRVELFLDGKSRGSFVIDHRKGKKLVADYRIPYHPGRLEALAYDENGAVVARDAASSFGDPVRLALSADRLEIKADGVDLLFLEISALDANGIPVANANNRVEVKVTGAGRLIGLDNGDSTDYDQYKGISRKLFSGKLLAVVASRDSPGLIAVEASSPGLAAARLELAAAPAPIVSRAVGAENSGARATGAIAVRKIEIVSPQGKAISEKVQSLTVTARLHPENASYQDVEWRATNDSGIDSNIAIIQAKGREASVSARGDGTFRLRCCTRNGGEKISLISQLEFSATGFGQAFLDPYALISGGLYTRSNIELGNGNERGVATARDGESQVCFDHIDFGGWGSDEITVPIFVLDSEPYPIQIWSGMPSDPGSEMLADEVYQKPSKWNTYQEETYRLSRRLKGVSSLCFVVKRNAHIKGFLFARKEKAFQVLGARDNDGVYGDSFVLREDSIEGIGNNVSLEFKDMDFGAAGCSRLTIRGRTRLEKNTIQLRFQAESGQSTQLAEFPRSEEYADRDFDLEPVKGRNKVTLIFLPGCDFDLKWIKFS